MSTNVKGDQRAALKRTMEAILGETQRKAAQKQLLGLDEAGTAKPAADSYRVLPERISELVYNIPAKRRLNDLVLSESIVSDVQEFFDEYGQAALLRANSLEPRHTVLMVGPPGNGKTSLAEVIATELALPLLSIRYDAIVDSYLGETANRLRRLIDYATLNPCVLFFDEFEAVGKERNDIQETGEIKRVVSSLLVQMDRLPSHTIIVCATNHPEMLDRAVWRRFELELHINPPGKQQLMAWYSRFEHSLGSVDTGISLQQFAKIMAGKNMSQIEAFTLNVRRKIILSKGQLSAADAVRHVLDRLEQRPINIEGGDQGHGDQLSDSKTQTRSRKTQTNPRKKT